MVIQASTIALGEEPVPFQITGGKVAEIHAHLAAWQHISEREAQGDETGNVELHARSHSVEGAMHRGPLQTNGLITIGADSISFIPTGKLDVVLLSAKVIKIPFEEICAVVLKGWPSSGIYIRTAEQEVLMSTENLEKWFEELVIQLEDWLEHRTSLDDEDGVLGSALAGWRFAVERDALEGAAFSIPALYRVGPHELRAGILAQTRGEFRFAYTHQTKNEETFFVPISEIAREYTENKQDNEIRFRAFRARYCFTPAGGQQAVQQFWSRCRIPREY